MRAAKHRLARLIPAVLALASLLMGFVLFQTLRPYDSVRFPEGNVSTVEPQTVEAGGLLTTTFPAYCNDGVDTLIRRQAEVLVDGEVIAAFELPAVSFTAPAEPFCASPIVQSIRLPNYVVGQSATEPGTFRLRNEISYRPNPFQEVTVVAFSDPFQVQPLHSDPLPE